MQTIGERLEEARKKKGISINFKIPGFGLGFRHYNNLSLTLSRMRALVGMLASMGTRFLTISEFLEELPRVRL